MKILLALREGSSKDSDCTSASSVDDWAGSAEWPREDRVAPFMVGEGGRGTPRRSMLLYIFANVTAEASSYRRLVLRVMSGDAVIFEYKTQK